MLQYHYFSKRGTQMKKIILPLSALAFSTFLSAQCLYNAHESELEFKAFKTPLKVGVKGTFDNYTLQAVPSVSQKELLSSSSVTIETKNVNTGNKGRDAKLVSSFFEVQGVKQITAKVLSVQGEIADVSITMNGVTKTVPMKIEFDDDEIELEGVIDLGDFTMLPSLQSINKACYALHKGKTWQDVELEFKIKTAKTCK